MRIDRIKLKTAMLKKDMKQTELAEMVGVSRPTISAITCGRSCKDETAIKIAKALGTTIDNLRE